MNKHDKFFTLKRRARALLTPSCRSPLPSLSQIHTVVEELDVCRIALELQNNELLTTQKHLHDTRQEYANFYNFSPVGYCSLNREGIIINANETLVTLLDTPKQQLINQSFADFVLKTDQDIFYLYSLALASLHNQSPRSCELRLCSKNKQPFWVKIDTEHHAELTLLAITDISRLKAMETDLVLAATIFEGGSEAIMIASPKKIIISVNKAFTRVTGYSNAEAVGQKTTLLQSGKQNALFYSQLWDSLNKFHHWHGEIWNKRKNGEIYLVWLSIFEQRNAQQETEYYVAIFSDSTERKIAESRIHFMAYYDALTSLANRALLYERLNGVIEKSLHNKDLFAVMMLDLDHFKVINDSLGHKAGDELLKEIATRLLSCTRKEDTVARLGGDEFVILLTHLGKNRDQAAQNITKVAEKVRNIVAESVMIEGRDLKITVSIGIVIHQNSDDDATHLIKNADNALYHAKDLGRDNFQFYTENMKITADFRLAVENELRYALEYSQLELYYQPQVTIADNRICGAEALLRWHHPEKGMISPASFIPIAEQTGLIILIGTWAMKTVCLQIAEWNRVKPANPIDYIAINVSPRQFIQQNFVELVINTINETGINPNQLELELTEGILIRNIDDTLEKLQALKAFGVRIAIDDFGTGYSSLNYIKRFPLDVLKVDKSFIDTVTTDANDAAIVQTIITLAKSLQIRVMAEGVETEEQLAFLRLKNCDAFQGYLCSYPVTKEAFLHLLGTPRN
ncbi:MAG: EAL domain-containing protein [Methylococcaceae bacterium]|nr:EAL domain-containing protein [Methylococcaceae bacterium]MDD1615596.1 EAL domain-containing protein [Methylococcaceae bacterium]OYV19949.1 MAG: response regulator receiver modulated PAS/PAC sensor-containing diguanylate cyclase/phosphodiesterase [Methylococcaceae bacterium NSP1-2]